ncbi:MAG: sulfatase-like hydrolase/transferase [Vicinamibacterales bacterium]
MRGRWVVATLPLAPLAAVAYLFSEWLFFVTKPSPTAALPFADQLLVLVKSPTPALLPLLVAQVLASLVSALAYPRLRGAAYVPAAGICGFLLLVLFDNFTYTVFGFGIVSSGEALRLAYAALLPMLVLAAGWKLDAWMVSTVRRRSAVFAALGITALLLSLPALTAEEKLPRQPDPSVLPALRAGAGESDRPNILFLGIDGLDAAITSAYGYERPTTPFLDSIKDETVFYEHAFANVARTHGSLVSLLTGRLPFSTRVTFPPTLLQGADGDRTLPMLLKSLGYTTLQLGMRHYADAEDTNVRGFDAANYRWQRLEEIGRERAAADETAVFRAAVAERIDERLNRLFGTDPVADGFAHVEGRQVVPQWRDERRVATLVQYFASAPEPWFVHLHLLDTHCCNWTPARMHFTGGPSRSVDARDSQVREADDNVRRLFEALAAAGRLERTIVVVNSDHASNWKTTEQVPLMIRYPGRRMTGRVRQNVQIADVAPTVLSYLGADVPPWMDGVSLLNREKIPEDRPIFAISDIQSTAGPAGARQLKEGGARNYGASAVMMVLGDRVFELGLDTGELRSTPIPGQDAPQRPVTDAEARRRILELLAGAGLAAADPVPTAAGRSANGH